MRNFEPGWVGLILLRNLVLALLVYSAWHLWLYVWRKQETAFKYNRQWPREVIGLPFRQPDLRQYVPHARERRADLDRL